MRGHELGDLVHFVRVPVLLQRLEVAARGFYEALFVEPGRSVDHRTGGNGCGRTTEDRTHGWLLLERFTLHRRVTGRSELLLLLATTSGDETEDQERDDRHDQDVEDLHALEAVAHEHGSQQATGRDTGQRAEPARSTASLGSSASGTGSTSGRRSAAHAWRRRSHLAGLVSRRSACAFATTEALGGIDVETHRQADAQRHGDAKKTFHKGNSHLWKARAPCCTAEVLLASGRVFRAFA
ncbi:hypothetical protein D3C81_1426590 [compost metagenome]